MPNTIDLSTPEAMATAYRTPPGRLAIIAQAKAEQAARKEALTTGVEAPITPAMDFLSRQPNKGSKTARSTREPAEPRFDQRVGKDAWQIALWAKGEGPLVEELITSAWPEAEAKRPRLQDEHWLRIEGVTQARRMLAVTSEALAATTNAYHGWLLDLLVAQLRQAFPTLEAPDNRTASQVATQLNALRAAGAITDWRAFTPPGPTKLSFRVTFADGHVEDLVRPRHAATRLASVEAEPAPAKPARRTRKAS